MNLCLAVSLVSCTVGYVPVAPWFNAKDCNAAIAQQIAWHNKRYPYTSFPASLINHCKHDPIASKRDIGYALNGCKRSGSWGPATLCGVWHGPPSDPGLLGGCCPPQCCSYDTCENFNCPSGLTKKKDAKNIFCRNRHQPLGGGPWIYKCNLA